MLLQRFLSKLYPTFSNGSVTVNQIYMKYSSMVIGDKTFHSMSAENSSTYVAMAKWDNDLFENGASASTTTDSDNRPVKVRYLAS